VLQESQRFRCPKSTKLICEPVMIFGDTKTYDLKSLSSIDPSRLQPNLTLKEYIIAFSLKSLRTLETCLQKYVEAETVIALIAECISVLDPSLHIESIVKAFIKTPLEQVKLLLQSLSALVPPEFMRVVANMMVEREESSSQAIEMFRHFLIAQRNPHLYDSDFSALLAFLNKSASNPQAEKLAIDVIETCNPSQLAQLQQVLNSSMVPNKQHLIKMSLRTLKREGSVSETLIGLLDLIVQVVFEHKSEGGEPSSLESLQVELERLDAKLNALKAESRRVDINSNEVEDPECIYSYKQGAGTVHWTSLKSGDSFTHTFPLVKFYQYCSWCAIPQDLVYFTGGSDGSAQKNEVFSFDRKSLTLTQRPPMMHARYVHSTVHTRGYLYVIGGHNGSKFMSECERFSDASGRWETISPLPLEVGHLSVIVQESTHSLYAIGGHSSSGDTDAIQELNLATHYWKKLSFSLPSKAGGLNRHNPIFKFGGNSEDYFLVHGSKLYSWNPHSAPRHIRDLPSNVQSYYGQSHYSQGTLYCSNHGGAVQKLEIGSLV